MLGQLNAQAEATPATMGLTTTGNNAQPVGVQSGFPNSKNKFANLEKCQAGNCL